MNRLLTDEALQFKVAVALLIMVGLMFAGFVRFEAQMSEELVRAGIDIQKMVGEVR